MSLGFVVGVFVGNPPVVGSVDGNELLAIVGITVDKNDVSNKTVGALLGDEL